MTSTDPRPGAKRPAIPVILDTDIGTDIDDTWALAMMLRCPELDVRLVTTATGDTTYRAKIAGKLLHAAGRADVAIGIGGGPPLHDRHRLQAAWVEDYDLKRYPGSVHADGVGALIETVMRSPSPITVVGIGPLSNVAEALRREPRAAGKARFVGMHGNVRTPPEGKSNPIAEYNVKTDAAACRAVFEAAWNKTITPLDTCGTVRLRGSKYRAVAESRDPLARAVIENYAIWQRQGWGKDTDASSVLFDCVAVYLAYADDLLKMERIGVRVTHDGFTVEDPDAPPIACALAWRDLPAFEDLIVRRVTGRTE